MQIGAPPSGLDMAVLMVPTVAFMVLAMFGQGDRFASSPRYRKLRRRFCEIGPDGHMSGLDPDGSPWQADSALERGSTSETLVSTAGNPAQDGANTCCALLLHSEQTR